MPGRETRFYEPRQTRLDDLTNLGRCGVGDYAGRCEHAISDGDDADGNNLTAVSLADEVERAMRFYVDRSLQFLPSGVADLDVYIAEDPRAGGTPTTASINVLDDWVDSNDTLQKRLLAFHEMQHLVQYNYAGPSSWQSFYGEGVARAIEDRIEPDLDADTGHLFIPEVNAVFGSEANRTADISTTSYRSVLWWTWLMDQYRLAGDADPVIGWSALRDFYVRLSTAPDQLSALRGFVTSKGGSFSQDFIDYTLALYAHRYSPDEGRLRFLDDEISDPMVTNALSGHTVLNGGPAFATVSPAMSPRSTRYFEYNPASQCQFVGFSFDGRAKPYGLSVMTVGGGALQNRWTAYGTTFARTVRTAGLDRVVGQDVLVVMDHSGSMADSTKLVSAGNAASLLVNELSSNDQGAYVHFNQNAQILAQLDAVSNNRAALIGAIAGDAPVGMTSIGGGMALAAVEHDARGKAESACSFVLLSDGQENSAPLWGDVGAGVADNGCAIHTVALGPEANEVLMQQIAGAVPGGSYDYNLYQPYIVSPTLRSNVKLYLFIGAPASRLAQGARVPILAAFVGGGAPIAGATVTAAIRSPGGAQSTLIRRDDGGSGDGEPGDGIYGGLYSATSAADPNDSAGKEGGEPSVIGSYQVTLTAIKGRLRREAQGSFAIERGTGSDDDGLPDDWERAGGLDPKNRQDAGSDYDRDGLTALCEFSLGASPRNADSDGGGESDGSEAPMCKPSRDPLSASDDRRVRLSGLSVQAVISRIGRPVIRLRIGAPEEGLFAGASVYRRVYAADGQLVQDWQLLATLTAPEHDDASVTSGYRYAYQVVPQISLTVPTGGLSASETLSAPTLESAVVAVKDDPYAPTGSVRINGGARTTNIPTVTLTLSADDSGPESDGGFGSPPATGSPASELMMRFSSSPDFTGAQWRPFQRVVVDWSLGSPSPGQHVPVYVQFIDKAGNISEIGMGQVATIGFRLDSLFLPVIVR